jgi:methylenetetrahydrofolate reductase (NADPH)
VTGWDVVAEIDVPHRPDLGPVRRQVAELAPLTDHVLAPDNPTARPAVSGIAVTAAARDAGARVSAVLNARDRNRLGLRRDLLGLLALGVGEVLLLRGDPPDDEAEDGPLGVRTMLDEARALADEHDVALRLGVVAPLGRPLARWKRAADAIWLPPAFSVAAVTRWREQADVDVPVRAGVIVPTGPRLAAGVERAIPDLELPAGLAEALDDDPDAGVAATCEHVLALREAQVVDGVHLVAVSRAGEVARRLGPLLAGG